MFEHVKNKKIIIKFKASKKNYKGLMFKKKWVRTISTL